MFRPPKVTATVNLAHRNMEPVDDWLHEEDEAPPHLEAVWDWSADDNDIVSNAIINLAKTGDPRLEDFLEFYRNSSVYIWNNKIVVCEETIEDEDFNELAPLINPLDKKPILDNAGNQIKPDVLNLIDVSPSRKHRIEARNALILLTLSSHDNEYRLSAVKKSGMPPYNYNAIPVLKIIQNRSIIFTTLIF